jgi:hypothetical protein
MTTISHFYDGNTGKLMQMKDLHPLDLPNPMDPDYKTQRAPLHLPKINNEDKFEAIKEQIIQQDMTDRRY